MGPVWTGDWGLGLGLDNEMNLDLNDFLIFESQGRVWLLFWQIDDSRSVKQQVFKLNAFRVRTPVH